MGVWDCRMPTGFAACDALAGGFNFCMACVREAVCSWNCGWMRLVQES